MPLYPPAAAAGGTTGLIPYNTTNFYFPWGLGGMAIGTGTGQAGALRCFMAYIKGQATLDVLGVRVQTSIASGNFQLAIYAVSPATGLPTGSALATTGNLSTAATGNIQGTVNSGVPVQLGSASAGVTPYAFCINNDATAGTTFAWQAVNSSPTAILGSDFGANTANNLCIAGGTAFSSLTYTQTFGTWPSLTAVSPTSYNSFGTALPYLHFSSVP